MSKLQVTKILLTVTAILFVVKPFLGYGVATQLAQTKYTDNIIVKIFSKRKPEFLTDAHEQKDAVVQQLGAPPLKLVICISALFACSLLQLTPTFRSTNRFMQQLISKLLPDKQTYLFIGKLTI